MQKKKKQVKIKFLELDSDKVVHSDLHRQVHSMQMLHLPWVVKACAISVKTGLTSFGKVDLPFHAPVSQQSVKTRRHSSTGLEFYDHQENGFTPKKSSFPYLLFLVCPLNIDVNCLFIDSKYITVQDHFCTLTLLYFSDMTSHVNTVHIQMALQQIFNK